MKTKCVNRYYCDFCNKGSGGAAAMKKHEKHCTMNPARVCRMCKTERDLPELVAELKEASLDDIRTSVSNCPACILSVLRQRKGEFDFDYNTEAKAVFASRDGDGYVA